MYWSSATEGTDTVAKQGTIQTRLFQQITLDDAGEILVVGDMLREYDEGDGDVGDGDGGYIAAGEAVEALEGLKEGEIWHPGHIGEETEVDDLKSGILGGVADNGEDGGDDVTGKDADDEGNHLKEFLAENGAEHGGGKSYEAADHADIGAGAVRNCAGGTHEIAYCVAGEGESDDGDRGSDNDGGHELIDPAGSDSLYDESDYNVHKTGEESAENETEVADLSGSRAGEGRRRSGRSP